MGELVYGSTRYYITIISGGLDCGSVDVSFCFARCPSALTQKLNFTGLVTGDKNKPQIWNPHPDLPIHYTTFMMTSMGTLLLKNSIVKCSVLKKSKSSLGQNLDSFCNNIQIWY